MRERCPSIVEAAIFAIDKADFSSYGPFWRKHLPASLAGYQTNTFERCSITSAPTEHGKSPIADLRCIVGGGCGAVH